MPKDATFQSVTFNTATYNPHFDTENIIVTTKGYHNFEITIVYDETGHVISSILHRVYFRYGYYNSVNEVKATQGYVAFGFIIPPIFDYMTTYMKQYIAVYDTLDYPE
jgi:hypothetical protein